ncbi:MAG TPA: MopE-related protein [Longimicrobiales bacterium]
MRSRISASVWAAVPLVLLLACSDGGPTAPQNPTESVPLQLSANVSGTPIATLVVEVTAPDITTPLAYNLHANNGQASGSIQIPPGSARTITVRAFDTDGTVTHEGSATVDVARGNNPPVQIPLVPRSGHQPIDLTLAEVSVTVNPPSATLGTGEILQLSATVVAAGGVLDVDVAWATLDPSIATVSEDGAVTAVSGGTVMIVATYAGVGAATSVTVVTGDEVNWFADADGDGFGDPGTSVLAAFAPPGYIADNSDCNDADPMTYPGAYEYADGNDNDCNGVVDDTAGLYTWYLDADFDGYGEPYTWVEAPFAPYGYVGDNSDCNDSDGSTYPGAYEYIDGVDNDCDGIIDNGGGAYTYWYYDADGDAYGNPFSWIYDYSPPPGYVGDNTDCDDSSYWIFPGATEVLNGADDDCDGEVDEGV